MKRSMLILHLLLGLLLITTACQEDIVEPEPDPPTEEKRVGFELIEIVSPDSIVVWVNNEILIQAEFDSIQLESGWRKNEPREGDPDGSSFHRSPNATEDGEFIIKELYGFQWMFNAQIVNPNVPLPENDSMLLAGRSIAKYHQVRFNAGKTIYVLIAPDGKEYIRVSRDANRTTDIPIIPDSWRIEERIIADNLTIDLPNPTLNIRAENNQDSFQGPIN